MSRFAALGGETKFAGHIVTVSVERFRHPDGEVVTREKVAHPGAVGIVALDDTHVWLVRQPREVAGLEDSLEIPAGKRDVPGEEPLATAKRELAEEIGKQAARWREIKVFFTSPGFSDERIWLYLATDLSDAPPAQAEPEENERIEIVPWPLSDLDGAVAACEDSKSLIALLWLQNSRRGGGPGAGRASPSSGSLVGGSAAYRPPPKIRKSEMNRFTKLRYRRRAPMMAAFSATAALPPNPC